MSTKVPPLDPPEGIKPQIIAMGGGGFTMEPRNPLLDLYILGQAQRERPRILFLPTAGADSDNYVRRFYETFSQYPCEPSYLSVFRPPADGMGSALAEKDIIYVGGGNTVCLLALLRGWGLDVLLRRAWDEGTILCGLSAGSICWFENGVTDSMAAGKFVKLECLGFLPGSHCPHYDSEPARQGVYRELVQRGEIEPGWALEDGVALHYVGTEVHRIVSSRSDARAYRVEKGRGEASESETVPSYLGGPSSHWMQTPLR